MNKTTLYGEASSEVRARENQVCRQIVKEVINFGVTQRQMLLVIYLLALELENVENMRNITQVVREAGGLDMFLSGNPEVDTEIVGGNDGSFNV